MNQFPRQQNTQISAVDLDSYLNSPLSASRLSPLELKLVLSFIFSYFLRSHLTTAQHVFQIVQRENNVKTPNTLIPRPHESIT